MARRRSVIGAIMNAGRPPSRPIPFNDRWSASPGGLYGAGPMDRFTQINAMGSQGTLFGIVQLLSTGSQAMGGWRLYAKQTRPDQNNRYSTADLRSDQRKEVPRHAALKLWNQPNPFMTGDEFREIGWQFMELVGEWYWVLARGASGRQIPTEMWPVRPDRMEPVPDPNKFLKGWVYTGPNGQQVPLLASEVIQLKYPNPSDMYRGLSAVQALLADIDSAKYTAEWSRNFFLNSATPGGIVQFQKRLTDPEFDEFVNRWREQHQGVARGHRVGVLEMGAQWIPNTYTMRDMQFIELRRLAANNIREAYRIHPSMLGMVEDVNRANAETAEQVHIRWHEVSRLKRLRTVLNRKFLTLFANTDVEFDFDDPLPASAEDAREELTAKSKAAQILREAGWEPDDILQVVGLPKMRYTGPPAPMLGGGVPGQPQLPGKAARPALPAGPSARPSPNGSYEGHPVTGAVGTQAMEDDGVFDMDLAAMLREEVQNAILLNSAGR